MSSPIVHLARRKPSVETRIHLFTRAGGRCEFDNCNRLLLEHHITKATGNYAEMAHIVAFSQNGPRGEGDLTPDEREDLSNLMLLCPTCHKHIDDHPDTYPVEVLMTFKGTHERRIFMLTDTKPDKHTVPLVLKAMIGSSPVDISVPAMQQAVSPWYLDPREVLEIDLTSIREMGTDSYWITTSDTIAERVKRFYDQKLDSGPLRHVSVFALAPIPLLVALGANLSNKIPTALFQRHRDTEEWGWKNEGPVVSFGHSLVREGTSSEHVALMLSLSGRIAFDTVESHIDGRFSVYEVAPQELEPTLQLLRLEQDLRSFRDCYMALVRLIVAQHSGLKNIHLFPALPAPAAVAIGFDLMPKCDPALTVYDFRRDAGGFAKTLEVNSHETK